MNWALHLASFGSKMTSSFAKGNFIRLSCRVAMGKEAGWVALFLGLEKPAVVEQFSNGRMLNPGTSPINTFKNESKEGADWKAL